MRVGVLQGITVVECSTFVTADTTKQTLAEIGISKEKRPHELPCRRRSRTGPCFGIAESGLFGAELSVQTFPSSSSSTTKIQKANALDFSTLFSAWLPYRSMPLSAAESERLFVEYFV